MVNKKKMFRKSKVDRISQLPAPVIQLILNSLPIKAAGRTSVLSREWRHHWRNVTRLVFDHEFCPSMRFGDWKSNLKKIIMRFQEVLQLHDGPIAEFVLSVPALTPFDIGHLMSYVSNKGVSALSLQFHSASSVVEDMSPSLFSASQLDSLKLSKCKFRVPSWFGGFTRLTVLELDKVSLPSDFFQSFLRKCPLLEDLRVSLTGGPRKLKVVGAPQLKVFIFRALDLGNISFECTPLLSVVSIEVEMLGTVKIDVAAVDMASVFAALPALQHLNLSLECLKILAAGPVPDKLSTALDRLEVLVIRKCHADDDSSSDDDSSDGDDNDDEVVDDDNARLRQLDVLLCLVRSSPNLHKLTINMKSCGLHDLTLERELIQLESEPDGYADPEANDSYCRRLSEVIFEACSGSQVEMELLRFVLANSPRLCRIVIHPQYKLHWQECLKFMEKVRHTDWGSKKAEIIFMDGSHVIFRL